MPILLSTFAIMIDWNIIFSQIATVAFDIIYFGAIIGTIVVVILDNRNPVKTMAWILVLMFLPIVGLVFYFFFGRSQRRERIIGKKSYGRLLKKPMAEYLAQGSSVLPEAYERLIKLFQHTNQALPFEGNRVLALIHDVGDRVRHTEELIVAKKKAVEADRLKSVFLATMSHEIRTPLNAIVGFSELLAADDCDAHREEYLDIIRKNSNLLLQLINDILDLSRIESGRAETHFQQVEITGLLEEVEKVHRLKMKEGVGFRIECPRLPVWISSDRNRLTQVLFNFLSNAIKNTDRGWITLGAKLRNDWLELFVTDTGRGIPQEKVPLIFDRFEKLNDFVQGTGLGLSICRSIAERLGGRIEVRSQVGEGSTFTLCLPCCSATAVCTDAEGSADRRRKVILVAEDVETNFKLLEAALSKEYVLRWVPNGQEAVLSFVRERPDLILMDIRMPVMNGIEATEKIRAISPDVPIVAVTAHVFYSEKEQALAAGCNTVVSKPYSPDDLRKTVRRLLGTDA